MDEAVTSFNLVDQPWINVLDNAAGRARTVSLAEAFARAHQVELAIDNAVETVALLRMVLLPVYWRSVQPPRDESQWGKRWSEGRLVPDLPVDEATQWETNPILEYLAEYRDRFDLFGKEPFGQVAELRTANGETRTAGLLVSSIPTGNSVPLFGVRTDADPPRLTPAQAARAMLATQCWDTAGLKSGASDDENATQGKSYGNPTGIVGQLGVVVPLGETLAQTLLLNTPVMRQGLNDEDIPPWEALPLTGGCSTRPATGIVDLLTWQARRIRLVPEIGENGSITVPRVVLTAGDRLVEIPIDAELHTMWRERTSGPKNTPAVKRPASHQPGREMWRGLPGLLASDATPGREVEPSRLLAGLAELRRRKMLPDGAPVRVLAVGMFYGSKSVVVDDVLVDVMPLPVAALVADSAVRRTVLAIAAEAEALRWAVTVLDTQLRRAVRAKPRPRDKGDHVGETLIHRLTPVVTEILSVLQRHPERAEQATTVWRDQARRLSCETAEALLAAMPPQAFLGQVEVNAKSGKTIRHNANSAAGRFYAEIRDILGVIEHGDQ
ncbi:type I-E CRISPR-associated protein Cse1/CasA [Nocardia gamkensis]|uniref:type I-E CRISPR-associated protein Cse1/CasA n=1 Tax=Nocardia gamkensis TaxID=352869 RepID=UPI0037C8CDDD